MGGYVFISYGHGDGDYVDRLQRHLLEAGLSAWTDSGIDYGSQWSATIATQIDGCAAFVPVMSPRSRESSWVRKEILYAQENNKTILPLLLGGNRFIELIDVQDEVVAGERMPSARFIDRLRALAGQVGPPIARDPARPPVVSRERELRPEAANDQDEFDVILEDDGGRKIEVIKVVRELTGLGLKEAKDLVDAAPSRVLARTNKENAKKARANLEAAGARVSLRSDPSRPGLLAPQPREIPSRSSQEAADVAMRAARAAHEAARRRS